MKFNYLIILVLFLSVSSLWAQPGRVFDPNAEVERVELDTTKLYAIDPIFYNRTEVDIDTAKTNRVIEYAPDFEVDQLILNSGRAQTYSLFIDDYRFHQRSDDDLFPLFNETYRKTPESSLFYTTNNTITDVIYTQRTQDEAFLNLKFLKQFRGKYDFYLDYTNVKDIGTYANQRIRHNNFGVHWQYKPNKKWQWQIEYFGNFTNDQHNGGLTTDTSLNDPTFNNRSLAFPVYLSNVAGLEHEDHLIKSSLHYSISTDSTRWYKELRFILTPYYQSSRIKYLDNAPLPDSDTTLTIYNLYDIDSANVRYRISSERTGADFSLLFNSLFELKVTGTIEQESFTTRLDTVRNFKEEYTNFLLRGDIRKDIGAIMLDGSATIGQKRDENVYNVQANLLLQPISSIDLYGKVEWARSLVSYYQQKLNELAFDETKAYDPLNTALLKVGMRYRYKSNFCIDPYIGLRTYTNPVYRDASGELLQAGSAETITQFGLKLDFETKLFELKNHFISSTSSDIIRKPNISNRARLTLKQSWLKDRLKVNIGVQATYINSFDSYYYHPWYQDFVLSDFNVDNSIKADAFINLRINTLRFMIMFENVSEIIGDNTIYFEGYPHNAFGIRLGLNWVFLD